MIMQSSGRVIFAALFSLFLLAGCATTEEPSMSAAEQAIADAKAANEEAKAAGYEWRDTGKIISQAEDELASGNDEKAIELANKAREQAEDALAQAKRENEKFMDGMSAEEKAALARADSSSSASRGAGGGVSSYSVMRGDNLWNISGKSSVYGNPYQWPLIYKNNRSQIKDADLIYPGQVFDIDQNASVTEIEAAIRHAKSRGAWSVGDVEQSDLNYLSR